MNDDEPHGDPSMYLHRRCGERAVIQSLHPGNRLRLMFGYPLLPQDDMKSDSLPESMLSKMSPADRAKIHRVNADANKAYELRCERDLQKQICQLLEIRCIAYFRQRMDLRATGTKGWPDITFALKGRAIAFECKFGSGKTSSDQDKCIAAMQKDGWHVEIVTTLEQARNIIDSYS